MTRPHGHIIIMGLAIPVHVQTGQEVRFVAGCEGVPDGCVTHDGIYINGERALDVQMKTLIHEAGHVWTQEIGWEIDEPELRQMETAYWLLMNENGAGLDWLESILTEAGNERE